MDSPDKKSDNSSYDINFLTGINWLLASNYAEALHFFLSAIVETDPEDEQYHVYQSYAGLCAVIMRQPGGLQHCQHIAEISLHHNPQIQLNLACAELFSQNRKHSIQAFGQIDTNNLSSLSAHEIDCFFDLTGRREMDANDILKRDGLFNRYLGRFFRKNNVKPQMVEGFIREIAQQRYAVALTGLQAELEQQLKERLKKAKNDKK